MKHTENAKRDARLNDVDAYKDASRRSYFFSVMSQTCKTNL